MTMKAVVVGMAVAAALMLVPASARAHCDTMEGPVVTAARAALEAGDVAPVLKWVKADNEDEVRAAFRQALVVRTAGPEAKELADRYFFETLVRLHRLGEGEPYEGLKTEAPEPGIAAADHAIESGAIDPLVRELTESMASQVRAKYAAVAERARTRDESVAAGRAWVEAYVAFIHYTEEVAKITER